MLSEQQIRLQLNDLHRCIAEVLESMDERAYTDADATLVHMQTDIACLRKDVSGLFDSRRIPVAAKLAAKKLFT